MAEHSGGPHYGCLRVNTERFNVIIEGTTLHGQEVAAVARELAKLIKRDTTFATSLLNGHPKTIKSEVDATTGKRYIEALARIGVAAHLEPETIDIDATLIEPNPVASNHHAATSAASPMAGNNKADSSTISKEECYRAAIGQKSQEFYLDYFVRADAAGKSLISWNWPAFLFSGIWALYRKMVNVHPPAQ